MARAAMPRNALGGTRPGTPCPAGAAGSPDVDRAPETRTSWIGRLKDAAATGLGPHPAERTIRIGLLVPFRGSDAIWGPSCQYSAVLAAAELNEAGGILGREVELFAADAGGAPAEVVRRARKLVEGDAVHALVGVHLSSVRVALAQAFAGRVPYIFAPLYEGGEAGEGVFAIGETPERQFPGAVRWLMERKGARRWYLIGNEYVWPRESHRWIRYFVEAAGGEVVGDDYVSLGEKRPEALVARIREAAPDIVFESLVGSDCVPFNRCFAEEGLDSAILRLTGAIEENTLLAIGTDHSRNLFCVAGYFSTLRTPENIAFLTRYRQAFGDGAPVQGNLSQSCYEAMRFLAALAQRAGTLDLTGLTAAYEGLRYTGARGASTVRNGVPHGTSFLAEADGTSFAVVDSFKSPKSEA